jgi:hypothetical protein
MSACTEHLPSEIEGTTSFRVEVLAPSELGSADMRLADGERDVTLRITALDEQGQPDPSFSAEIDLYTHFLGTLTPFPDDPTAPLATATLTAGVGEATVTLDLAYAATKVWAEDTRREGATFATGVGPEMWYRDPFLDDVSRPRDENALSALERSPLQKKQIKVGSSRFGATGRLVVTAVYAQGYTVSDVSDTGATTPYGHMFVFTFGRPRAEDGRAIEVGHLVKDVSGAVTEFNGYTELGFPQTNLTDDAPDAARVPQPAVIDPQWILTPTGATGMINLEKLESGLVAIDGATVCPLDEEFTDFSQWKLDVGFGCGKQSFKVITAGQVSGFDPSTVVGMTLPRVVGTLRAVNMNSGAFNVWILYPRQMSDITTN